jgi:serine protease inhibitor
MSGLGVWPLLAALADAADGPARGELAEAVGLPEDDWLEAARQLLSILNQSPALHTALGLWTAAAVPINPQWANRLPAAAHNVLDPDPARSQAALDAWVEKETDGLLHKMPVQLDKDTLFVLASALTVRTKWEHPFTESPTSGSGPWADRRRLVGLHRTTALADADVRIATSGDGTNPVTLATVRGRDEIDVVLALGEPDAHAGTVLSTAVAASRPSPLSGMRIESVGVNRPQLGPGLSVVEINSFDEAPTASLQTVAFTVNASHNLLAHAEMFGLRAASDDEVARFPGISETPLYVQDAAQNAMASFSAEGFVAAAVTAMAMAAAAAMPRQRSKRLIAKFDRPFGFVSVHRPTGLVLVCGWVSDPDDFPTL